MTRPAYPSDRQDRRQDVRMTLRLPPEEMQRLRALAKSGKMSIGAAIVWLMNEAER